MKYLNLINTFPKYMITAELVLLVPRPSGAAAGWTGCEEAGAEGWVAPVATGGGTASMSMGWPAFACLISCSISFYNKNNQQGVVYLIPCLCLTALGVVNFTVRLQGKSFYQWKKEYNYTKWATIHDCRQNVWISKGPENWTLDTLKRFNFFKS